MFRLSPWSHGIWFASDNKDVLIIVRYTQRSLSLGNIDYFSDDGDDDLSHHWVKGHMGQFPQDEENGQNVSFFKKKLSSVVTKRFDFSIFLNCSEEIFTGAF